MKDAFIYIMSNKNKTVLYIRVTNNIGKCKKNLTV